MIGARLYREQFFAMGTECCVAVTAGYRDAVAVQRALQAGRDEVRACEGALSRFDRESDLCRLNGASGSWATIGERLMAALVAALDARSETGGSYDPTILPALAAAGYDRSFEQIENRAPRGTDGWRPGATIELAPSEGRARVPLGAAVDLGGIGKGFAADRALLAMLEAWPELPGGLVDLGGDIAVSGATPEGGPWLLAVADARVPGATLGTLSVVHGGVSTSGRDQRRFGRGRTLHHLIDPSTGRPAEGGPLAVTVVAGSATEAEAHSTALAVMAVAAAPRYLASRPWLSALLVPDDGAPLEIGALPLHVDYHEIEFGVSA